MTGLEEMLLKKIFKLRKKLILKLKIMRLRRFINKNKLNKNKTDNYYQDGLITCIDFGKKAAKKKMERKIKEIIKPFKYNVSRILNFVEKKNTKIYRLLFVKRFLNLINEKEGFIPPKKGLTALYLNLITRFRLGLKTDEMFIFGIEDPKLDSTLRQFYRWYSYKMDVPGFEQRAINKFNKLYYFNIADKNMTLQDIEDIQEVFTMEMNANMFALEMLNDKIDSKKMLKKMNFAK